MTHPLRRLRLSALFSALLLTGCATAQPPANQSPWNLPGAPPHLVAHYLPWYETTRAPDDNEWTWVHWQWKGPGPQHDPNTKLEQGRRDLAAVVSPLIGPYASWSPAVVDYHCATAKAAGIEAFLVLWDGAENPSDKRIPIILEAAQRHDLKIAICYEEKVNWPPHREHDTREQIVHAATDDLNYLIEQYTSHPAYLRRNGTPFIYQFNCWGADELGQKNILPHEWPTIFAGLSKPIIYARQNLDEPYHPTIQGAYVWWTDDDWPNRFADEADPLVKQNKLDFYMTMICPGFDDTGVWGWGGGPRKSKSFGMPLLRRTITQATRRSPELIQIITWNDFNEGTVIEPTFEHGFAFLDALEICWSAYKTRPANLNDNRQPFFDYLRRCSPQERSLLPDLTVYSTPDTPP